MAPNIYNRCYEPKSELSPSQKKPPLADKAESIREDRAGAVGDGGGFLYAPQIQAGGARGLLSFGLDSGGEPASLYSQRGGGILAPTGLCLAAVHEGDGLLGEGE